VVPTSIDYWRALILYGKNSSTYKMGLGRCLLQYSLENRDTISLDELTQDFLTLYQKRCESGKPQLGISGRKTYVEHEIDALKYTDKKLEDSLEIIKKNALYDMVLKRFNVLNNQAVKHPFYSIKNSSYIVLNENLLELGSSKQQHNALLEELLSRWDLLEHAFETIHSIEEIDVDAYLKHIIKKEQRTNLTQLKSTLSGYQQNRCFYCGEALYDEAVDHVIPYSALLHNELWNLVLAHKICNECKSDYIPPKHFIENLIQRNEFFIASSHPIKDTLIKELGKNPNQRRLKIESEYAYAKKIKPMWGGNKKYNPRKDMFYRDWVKYLGNKI
jgi:hypothetical protein